MGIVINKGSIFLELFIAASFCCFLESNDDFRGIQVVFTCRTTAELVNTNRIKVSVNCKSEWIKCLVVVEVYIFRNFLKADTADTANCICKVKVDYIFCNTNGFKNLCRLVRLNCADTHLCCNLYDAADDTLIVVVDCCMVILVQKLLVNEFCNCFMCKIRIDCTGTVTKEHCTLMNIAYFRRFKDD